MFFITAHFSNSHSLICDIYNNNCRDKDATISFHHPPLNTLWFCPSAMSCWFVVHYVFTLPVSAVRGFGPERCYGSEPGVIQGPLVILDRTSEFRSRHESSSGRRSVRMFTLCNDPALQPRDIFPPVVTHGKGNIYQSLNIHTASSWSFVLIYCFCKCFKVLCRNNRAGRNEARKEYFFRYDFKK